MCRPNRFASSVSNAVPKKPAFNAIDGERRERHSCELDHDSKSLAHCSVITSQLFAVGWDSMDRASNEQARARAGGGRAFHSRLEPFVDFIREQRRRRKTWKEISESLKCEKDCPITFQGVYQFYRRFIERQARPHWERAVESANPASPVKRARSAPQASIPRERPFHSVNPAQINLNDPTQT